MPRTAGCWSRRRLSFVLCPGTGRKKAVYPANVIISDFCGASAMLRISARASRTTSRRTPPVKPAAGRFIRYTQHIAGQPTGRDMLNTIADGTFPPTKNVLPGSRWHRKHHGRVFVIFIEPAGVIAFLHNQTKAARLASQQRLTGGGQRAARIRRASSATRQLTLRTASRTAPSTALISSSVSHSPAYGKDTCVPSAGSTGNDCH